MTSARKQKAKGSRTHYEKVWTAHDIARHEPDCPAQFLDTVPPDLILRGVSHWKVKTVRAYLTVYHEKWELAGYRCHVFTGEVYRRRLMLDAQIKEELSKE